MGHYAAAAEYYDLLYAGTKDYAAEAGIVAAMIRDANPGARSVLDVGCGTGAHARALIDAGFEVDGVDLEPAFVEIARAKCPEGTFYAGDMTTLDAPSRYDAVISLFSAIGYVRTVGALRATVRGMRQHLNGGGVVIVDPWFEPGQLTDGWITTVTGEGGGASVTRMSRTVIDGTISRLEFEYLIGTSKGLLRRSEVHELGLFTEQQMRDAFHGAGLVVERKPEALRMRGAYVGRADRPVAWEPPRSGATA